MDGIVEDGDFNSLSDICLIFDPVEYVKRNKMFQPQIVPSGRSGWKRWIITDSAKHLERSLILLLLSYHKAYLCFSNLTMNDLCAQMLNFG